MSKELNKALSEILTEMLNEDLEEIENPKSEKPQPYENVLLGPEEQDEHGQTFRKIIPKKKVSNSGLPTFDRIMNEIFG